MKSAPDDRPGLSKAAVVLLWIPVGAGGHVVGHTSRWWERADAAIARRKPQVLFHAALEISVDNDNYVIEMAPEWSGPRVDHGVVATGPVGLRSLGRSALFRYEVRCWRGGTIPDRGWAVGGSTLLTDNDATARLLLRRIRDVPTLTWGRNVLDTGDMWNSNSLVSWLLTVSGIATLLVPPDGGRAPGWVAGVAMATTAN
ncbi:hypothetical protein V3G39_13630 [Dermatophilaceae bacterium Sec6.4]